MSSESSIDASPPPEDGGVRPAGGSRRDLIELEVAQHGYVSCSGLAQRLGVSEMTIRRDLLKLEQEGKLRRARGGAVGPRTGTIDTVEPDLDDRCRMNAAEKSRIGRHAARLCLPQHFVAVDIGSTTLCLAHALIGRNVRFFTCSLKIASVLTAAGDSVVIPGGTVHGSEPSLIGGLTQRQIANYRFDTLFLGVSGINASGLFDYSVEDSEIKRALIEHAARVVVLADRSKFDRSAIAKVCGLDEIDIFITDDAPAGALSDALADAGVTVSIASD